jgi:hypothetical protein
MRPRTLRKLLGVLTLCGLGLVACGGSTPAKRPAIDFSEDDTPWPDASVKSLQLYAVLTPDPKALQSEGDLAVVEAAIAGEGPRYSLVRAHVSGVPANYRLNYVTDFADLPHPEFAEGRVKPMVAELPEGARELAGTARLAVVIRSDAGLLPNEGHIRLAGLVALAVADKFGGVVLDLMARRAYTADAWHATLAASNLGAEQVRLVARKQPSGQVVLHSRGMPKFGLPDLELAGLQPTQVDLMRDRFIEAVMALRRGGPNALDVGPCTDQGITWDAGCASLAR